VESNQDTGLFPMNAGNRARVHGVLYAFHWTAFRFDDF
jgi:hypothetical protein